MADQEKAIAPQIAFNQKDFIKQVKNTDDLFLLKCPNCTGVHFRHAGYVEAMTPFVSLTEEAPTVKSSTNSLSVKLCVKCKHAYVNYLGSIHDVTEFIDLAAWEKTEKEAVRATGPGGQC